MASLRSGRPGATGRRIVWAIGAAFLATCLIAGIAIGSTGGSGPAKAEPSSVSIETALAAFTGATSYFLKVPGIPGESLDSRHANEIDVITASWGVTNQSGTTSGAAIADLKVTKLLDQSSPLLMKAAAAGTTLGTVVLSAVKNGGDLITYAVITITGAKARSFQQNADKSTGFSELDGFSYTSMKLTYYRQKADGTTVPITGCWNLATHVPC